MVEKKAIDIDEVTELIDFVWDSLLITRSVFNFSYFGTNKRYRATPFYRDRLCPDFTIYWQSFGRFENDRLRAQLRLSLNASAIIWIDDILEEAGLHKSSARDLPSVKGAKVLRNYFAHEYAKTLKNDPIDDDGRAFEFVSRYDVDPGTHSSINIRLDQFFVKWLEELKTDLKKEVIFIEEQDGIVKRVRNIRKQVKRLRDFPGLDEDNRLDEILRLLDSIPTENS